ncbi:MAG: YncE family protein [Candidatus Eisenbacteria bacterium]|uniref:YncE family protein n=1 Tax=Eiseniibacteriota bacterium TaxID=2212470 RepID=A0A538U7B3_UNCEI|nr:MAG: YncE family protein [Candidatus Eisenbacteria bacterium]
MPSLGRGFAASGRDSAIVVFDLPTLRVVSRLPVPARFPDALVYEPVTRRLFSFNGGSDNTSAFDAASGAFVDSLALGGTPEFAVADGAGLVYVNLESTAEVVAFDARSLHVLRRWSLAPGEEPTGLALDPVHHLLFSGCHNRLLVVSNAIQGTRVDTLAIGDGVDAVAFDARRRTIFTSNGEGTLSVFTRQANGRYVPAETDSTQRGARTMALDEKTGRVFVVTANFGPPPAPTPERPHPRSSVVKDTFTVLVLDR